MSSNSFTAKHAELWKFIKFSFAGIISTLIEFAVYYLLLYTVFKDNKGERFVLIDGVLEYDAKGVFWAFVISTTIGYIIAFLINRKTTFNADSNIVLSAIIYTAMVIFTIIATSFIGAWIMDFCCAHGRELAIEQLAIDQDFTKMGETVARWETIGSTIGKPIAAALATCWTYPLNRFVIHRKKK